MPSWLDDAAVRHVAHLARLDITEEEVTRFAEQLSSVLRYVEQLNELDTADVPPSAHALPLSNVFRSDSIRPSWTPDRALQNAPQYNKTFFQVPKVLDQDSS